MYHHRIILFISLLFSLFSYAESTVRIPDRKKRDTLFSKNFDTMTVRKFDRKGKLKWEDIYYGGELRILKFWYYQKHSYGYYLNYNNKKKPIITYRKEFYPNGKLKAEGSTLKNKPHGKYKSYYPNGNTQFDCEYIYGKQEGRQLVYFENGRVWSEIIFKDGKMWEVKSNFNPSGKPMEKGTLKDGNGTRYVYDETGVLLEIEHYKEGKRVKLEKIKTD